MHWHFEMVGGAAGDMLLSSVVAALPEAKNILQEGWAKLGLDGWSCHWEQALDHGFQGTRLQIDTKVEVKERHLKDILLLLEQSCLSAQTQKVARDIFVTLAEAEARVHGTTIEEVHFHEVGAVDSILDIVGFALLLDYFEVTKVTFGAFPVGGGTLTGSHGIMPNPAPATQILTQGYRLRLVALEQELVTPTGAAVLITTGKQEYGELEGWSQEAFGIGLGKRALPWLNGLVLSVRVEATSSAYTITQVSQLTCHLDDMTPEAVSYCQNLALKEGVLDAWVESSLMKKGRLGYQLTLLVSSIEEQRWIDWLFDETSTLGVRKQVMPRYELPRSIGETKVSDQPVKWKKAQSLKGEKLKPEASDIERLAKVKKCSWQNAQRLFYQRMKNNENEDC